MNNIAAYMRISVSEHEDTYTDDTINSQRNIIKSFIFSNDDLKKGKIEEFIDEGYSGSTVSRPALDRLLKKIKARKVDCVIVKDMSRFMRDYIEMGNYLENIFPFLGVRFIAINDGYDSSKEEHNGTDLDIQFKNLLNDYYCRDISEKMKTSLHVSYDNGKFLTGSPCYGYLKDPEDYCKVIVDDVVADNVRYIFQLIIEGNTLNETAKILNQEGIPTSRARRKQLLGYDSYKGRWDTTVEQTIWVASTVRRIIHNEFYTGTFVYNKSSKTKLDGGKCIFHPESEWKKIYNHHEPLISKETYDEARKILKSRYKKRSIKSENMYEKSPLSGFLKCSKCGYKVRYLNRNDGEKITEKSVYCYHCRMLDEEEKFPKLQDIENEVFDILKREFHIDRKDKKDLLDKQKHLYNQNDKLEEKKLKSFEKYKLGKLERESFIKIKNEIKEDTNLNLKMIEKIDEQLKSAGSIESLTSETVKKYIKSIYISANGIEKIEYR